MKTIDSFFKSKKVKHETIEAPIEALEIDVVKISEEVTSEKNEDDHEDERIHTDNGGMSEYEKVRIENIRRNEEFLLNLGLDTSRQPTLVAKKGYL
jgi:hypothetical protein